MAPEVDFPLLVNETASGFTLRITGLPGRREPELFRPAHQSDVLARLVEGEEYRYEWIGPEGTLSTEPSELFQPDTASGRAGRVRTGLRVGFIEVTLSESGAQVGSLELQVRSRKLKFDDEYQWMLRDIATELTELLMERFAASELHFRQDETRDAVTLYQRFEFLRALLQSGSFQAAVQQILRRPHTGWAENREEGPLNGGFSASASAAKQLARIGFRVGAPELNTPGLRRVERTQITATHDTTPNRFVRYALQHWLQVLGDIADALAGLPVSAPITRGRREVAALIADLDQHLHEDLFREVGRLARFPADDQVLQKREGYREVFRAYLEFELAALLSWKTPESHSASARDVATLYEYWAFLQLAKSVAAVSGAAFDLAPLLKVDQSGLSVGITKGQECVFSGTVLRGDRAMVVDLWFNRTYRFPNSSWTRTLRPDYSLTIRPAGEVARPHDVVILHFDAKYRVQFIQEFLAADSELPDGGDSDDAEWKLRGQATPGDLMKMHAYRDAIRRTSGAYVLYPGGDTEVGKQPLKEFHELLPGLGAFVLRPTDTGSALGDEQLRDFISQVIEHAATRLTEHERGRYWHEQVYGNLRAEPSSSLESPPPSTSVLLGFIKNSAHWRWVHNTSSYNLRALGRVGGVSPEAALFQSQILLLYCPRSGEIGLARMITEPELLSAEALRATGYPHPGGNQYWVVQLSWLVQPNWLQGITPDGVERMLASESIAYGAPAVLSWSRLTEGLANSS